VGLIILTLLGLKYLPGWVKLVWLFQLHINRRTLQDYRNMGRISFVKLGGKVLYREEDVEKLLQENYRPRFEKP